jgi:uncharacterized protein (DUF2147 family)
MRAGFRADGRRAVAAAALAAGLLLQAAPSLGGEVAGLWRGEEGTLVRLLPCDGGLCGEIVRPPSDGSELRLVEGFRRVSATRWDGGRVYDADDGATYTVELEMLDPANIRVRACWLVFCDTLLWRKVE